VTLQVATLRATVDPAWPYGTLQVATVEVSASVPTVVVPATTLQVGRVQVVATVAAAPPIGNAGDPQTVDAGALVTLTGVDSDTDGTVTSRLWRKISGPAVTLTNATSAVATYRAPLALTGSTLVFGYQVTDNLGLASVEDTVTHTALAATERAVVGGVEVAVRVEVPKT
jgi:hypothetical protein